MQLRYVFSETGTGLRRNVSMSVALIVTIFVSLTLVGMGLLLNAQADKAEKFWGSKLQITVFMCNQNSKTTDLRRRGRRRQQKTAIKSVIDDQPRGGVVLPPEQGPGLRDLEAGLHLQGQVRAGDLLHGQGLRHAGVLLGQAQGPQPVPGGRVSALRRPRASPPCETCARCSSRSTSGSTVMKWGAIAIAAFLLVAAILQVGNTIRMAAFARRKEIGIMRLVGASNLYISLPFLMETLVAALIGIGLASVALLAFMYFVIYGRLRPSSNIVEWVDWNDAYSPSAGSRCSVSCSP